MAGLEGKTLDRFELRKLIGRGGMADVYEGYDPYFQRAVAVKVFKREDDEMLRRFIREAKLMASLSNEHLVPIYGSGECQLHDSTQYYIVMPFMTGGTLRARIRLSPLSPTQACQSLQDIASALDYIHSRGIIHRDIKSSNVLLDADGRCYLADFGIARTTSDVTRFTSTGNVLGTVDYVAPELFEDNRKADALSDLYSLGVLLFEMVTGRLPFYAENQIAVVTMHVNKRPPSPRSLSQNISPQVERVILKALEKKPEQRYKSATQLTEAFCHAAALGNKSEVQERKPDPPLVEANPAPMFMRPASTTPPREVPHVAAVSNVASRPVERRLPRPKPPNLARRRALVVTILALLALLVVAIPFVIVARNFRSDTQTETPTITPIRTPNLTATAQTNATATALAQKRATAIAVAAVTATTQAHASATAAVLQGATAGKPAYQDILNDATNQNTLAANWDQNTHCAFQTDGYHVMEGVNLFNLHGCRESANTYGNVAISVHVRLLSGRSGGLFFRVTVDTFGSYSGGYLFEIDSAGNYRISSFNVGPQTLQSWMPAPALKQGNGAENTLQVVARNGTLLFYANGVFLTSINDTTYTSGVIAFLATTAGINADIVYSNLKVYPL